MPLDLAAEIKARSQLTGSFPPRSGATSDTYFDKYRFEADPALLAAVGAALVPLVPDGVDVLAGLELGGVPIATVLSGLTGLPARFVRKAPKPYGTEQVAEGGPVDGLRLLIVEDVVTSGGAILHAAAALRELGATVTDVVCAIDREAGGADNLAAEGLTLRPLLTAADLAAR